MKIKLSERVKWEIQTAPLCSVIPAFFTAVFWLAVLTELFVEKLLCFAVQVRLLQVLSINCWPVVILLYLFIFRNFQAGGLKKGGFGFTWSVSERSYASWLSRHYQQGPGLAQHSVAQVYLWIFNLIQNPVAVYCVSWHGLLALRELM